MDNDLQGQPVDLRESLAVLRARKWTVIAMTLLVVASALAYSFTRTPLYRANARLLVKGVPNSAGIVSVPNLETEGQIVASHPVATLVGEELGLDIPPQELINGLRVEAAAEESSVLTVSYTTQDAQLAASVPNAFSTGYIEYQRQQAQAASEAAQQAIQAQIDPIEEQLEELNTQLSSRQAVEDLSLRSTLETERAALSARLAVLQQRLSDVLAAAPVNLAAGELIEPAVVPSAPASPDHIQNGSLAAVLGLVLGVALAFLRERLDDRLKGREDLERSTKVPVLAAIPRYTSLNKRAREIITISQPRSAASEAYRSLRTNVQFLSLQSELRTLLMTSAAAGEGKTVTSVNLAVAFAHSGRRVILVSADLRRPTLEGYFGLPNREGLSSWLTAADRELWGLIVDPGIDNLRVLPSGPVPPNPAELLSSPRFGELVRLLKGHADLVIIDSAPALAVADSPIISSQIDGTILVIDGASTHRSPVIRAAEELRRVGADLLGTVFNSYDLSAGAYYSSGYYGSTYEPHPVPGEESDEKPRRRSLLGRRR